MRGNENSRLAEEAFCLFMRMSHLAYFDVITFYPVIVLLPTFPSFGGQRGFFKTIYCCSSRPLNQQNFANHTCVCTISQIYPVTVQVKKRRGKTDDVHVVISLCAGLFEVFSFSSARLFLLAGQYVHLTLMASLAISQRIFQTTCF